MADFEWRGFLQQWSRDLLASPLAAGLPDEVKQSQWAGFAPASEEQIAAAEKRLKIQLPPSYRDFLRVSNGWRNTTNFINRVRGTQEINWFRKTNRDWVDAYAGPMSWGDAEDISDNDYFGYGKFIQEFKPAHLKETLQISEEGDAAVYLLNPQVISKDGEWEAWFLANWLPGVHRYRSFLEMMQADYHQFA